MELRPELASVASQLIERHRDRGEVGLDALGEAIGELAISHDEIDALISALESAGLEVGAPSGDGAALALRAVLPAARALERELGRRPTIGELAARTGLPPGAVRSALLLGQMMAR
jgi:hypothetical protein